MNYKSVKRILEHGLDRQDDESPVDSHGQRLFVFARVAGYFNKSIMHRSSAYERNSTIKTKTRKAEDVRDT